LSGLDPKLKMILNAFEMALKKKEKKRKR